MEKQFRPDLILSEKTEVHAQQQKEYKNILIGKIKPQRGHTLWEINIKTGSISEAKYNTIDVDFAKAVKGDFSHLKELIVDENCVYIPALNRQNALKKYQKCADQSAYYKKQSSGDIKDITF